MPSAAERGADSGDLYRDRVVATRIAEGSTADWPGPFGDPQTHQMAAPADPQARPVAMRELSDDRLTGPERERESADGKPRVPDAEAGK